MQDIKNPIIYGIDIEELIKNVVEEYIATAPKGSGEKLRMRTIKECADYFKASDSETPIKESTIKHWMVEKKIPVVHVGKRKLINLDMLIEYVNTSEPIEEKQGYGTIRRVQ